VPEPTLEENRDELVRSAETVAALLGKGAVPQGLVLDVQILGRAVVVLARLVVEQQRATDVLRDAIGTLAEQIQALDPDADAPWRESLRPDLEDEDNDQ
jgi:hypothetical protein